MDHVSAESLIIKLNELAKLRFLWEGLRQLQPIVEDELLARYYHRKYSSNGRGDNNNPHTTASHRRTHPQ